MPSAVRAHFAWCAAVAALITTASILLTRPGTWWDLHVYHLGFTAFWHHMPAYRSTYFMWSAPSTLLLFSPLGAAHEETARVIVRVLGVACLFAAAWTSLAVVWGRRPPWRWVVGVFAAFILFEPARTILRQGNIGVISVPLVAAALLCAVRRRWTAYGVLLGLGLAVKPVAVALILLPLLYRQWRAAAIAVGVPLSLSIFAVAVDPHPGDFFSRAVPHLLHGYSERWFSDGSVHGVLTAWGTPHSLVLLARIAVGAAMLAVALMRHRRGGPEGLRVAETAGCLVLATTLASTMTWNHYLLFALPMLVGIARRGSVMRSPLAILGLVLVFEPFRWSFTPLHNQVHAITVIWASGMALIALAGAVTELRRTPSERVVVLTRREQQLVSG